MSFDSALTQRGDSIVFFLFHILLYLFLSPSQSLSHTTEYIIAEISPVHSLKEKDEAVEHVPVEDPDAEFGGKEERRRIERKLLWKLDCRMSIMIVIYILNYVSAI